MANLLVIHLFSLFLFCVSIVVFHIYCTGTVHSCSVMKDYKCNLIHFFLLHAGGKGGNVSNLLLINMIFMLQHKKPLYNVIWVCLFQILHKNGYNNKDYPGSQYLLIRIKK